MNDVRKLKESLFEKLERRDASAAATIRDWLEVACRKHGYVYPVKGFESTDQIRGAWLIVQGFPVLKTDFISVECDFTDVREVWLSRLHQAAERLPEPPPRPVLQRWVWELPLMQQACLIQACRGPDGLHKHHPAKAVLRWYRRCFLLMAFTGEALQTPWEPGGGSFTGPSMQEPPIFDKPGAADVYQRFWKRDSKPPEPTEMGQLIVSYLKSIDEVPLHFHMHLVHATQILGYKHPIAWIREYWRQAYLVLVEDLHLCAESQEAMDARLSDDPERWKRSQSVDVN